MKQNTRKKNFKNITINKKKNKLLGNWKLKKYDNVKFKNFLKKLLKNRKKKLIQIILILKLNEIQNGYYQNRFFWERKKKQPKDKI
jgi:hypothetical protein